MGQGAHLFLVHARDVYAAGMRTGRFLTSVQAHEAPHGPVMLVAPEDCGLDGIPTLAQRLSLLVARGFARIVLDARNVRTVDSTLPGLLARTHRQLCEDGGRLAVVAGPVAPVAASIAATGWDDVLELFATVEGAFESFAPEALNDHAELGWCQVRSSPRGTRLVLRGEWDISNVPTLEAALRGLDGVSGLIEVDLEGAGFIDLSVVGCLRRARQARLSRGGSLRVVGAHGEPLRAIQLSGHTELLLGVAGFLARSAAAP
jgi:anti-anti-sigma regulatory factor